MRQGVLVAVGLVLVLAMVSVGPAMGAPGGGNSGNAKACQHGGYLTLQRVDGTRFSNVGECVSYTAQGGVLVAIATVTLVPTEAPPPTEESTATGVPPTAIPPTEVPPTLVPTATDVSVVGTITFEFAVAPDPAYCLLWVVLAGFDPDSYIGVSVSGAATISVSVLTDSDGAGRTIAILGGKGDLLSASANGVSAGPVPIAC